MPKITLVCSGHRENGLCNAEELLKILRAISPDAVFEEMGPSDFDFYYTRGSVEAHAITRYREFKSFEAVPVDRHQLPKAVLVDIKRDFDRVIDCAVQASQEYRQLSEEIDYDVCRHGFQYLNSVACAATTARMSDLEDEIIRRTCDQGLIRGLERWRQAIQRRELGMVGNIYEYCQRNAFGVGVFLVGAAHRAGIVEEIERRESIDADLIDWKCAYDGPMP